MKKVKIYQLVMLTFIGLIIYSCQVEEFIDVETEQNVNNSVMKFGDDLNIPYTQENMSKAYQQVLNHLDKDKTYGKSQFSTKSIFSAKTSSAKSIEITPSHYYYRFLPKDSLEYETLIKDTILSVTNTPLHKELLEDGDYYDDPEILGDENGENFGWLYSVLPYNYEFPSNIQNEKLEDMYFAPEIEEENEPLAKGESMLKVTRNKTTNDILTVDENGEVFEYLELEALKLTNNLDEEELEILRFYRPNDNNENSLSFYELQKEGYSMSELILDYDSVDAYLNTENAESSSKSSQIQAKFWRRRKWTPSGRLTVEEDALTDIGSTNNIVGVMGAEVKVRKWGFLVIRKTRTNRDGSFSTRSTRTKRVKYAVYFNDADYRFTVKAGTVFWNARHRSTSTHKRKAWNKHFGEGGRSHFYALVQNAAFDFYDRIVPEYGLEKPRYVNISAKYNSCATSQHRPVILSSLLPVSDIRIVRNGSNCNYRNSDGVYSTTIHELAHASHRQMDPGMFSIFESGSCNRAFLIESWAEGVETIVTNDRYFDLDENYNSTNSVGRRWNEFRQRHEVDEMTEYTPIVDDLVDNINQNTIRTAGYGGIQPIDNVSGYNLEQIENALNNCRNIDCWENNLRDNYLNSTEENLTELFNYMRDARNNDNEDKCD